MSVILNEIKWCEDMLSGTTLGKKPSETLFLLAKYYLYIGYSKAQTKGLLERFLLKVDPAASLVKWEDLIDFSIKRAAKSRIMVCSGIEITDTELNTISSLEGKQVQRLAFTLLCLAKYWDLLYLKTDHWVNSKDSEIMKMANINTSTERQSMMYHELNRLGLISFSKSVDNTNVKVDFVSEGEVVLVINDFRNLGYQYMKYAGATEFYVCQNCGITTKQKTKSSNKGRKPKYCSECAREVKLQQSINSVMRIRQ